MVSGNEYQRVHGKDSKSIRISSLTGVELTLSGLLS